jgi:hypothetical protein
MVSCEGNSRRADQAALAEKLRLMRAARGRVEHQFDLAGRPNRFRRPITLPATPWDEGAGRDETEREV